MGSEVKADYGQLEQIAKKFADQAGQAADILQWVRDDMAPLEEGGWVGRGSQAFFKEMRSEVLPALERLRKALDEASQVTTQVAQTLRQGEEDGQALFKAAGQV